MIRPAAASNVLAGRFTGLQVAEALSKSARDERARAIQRGDIIDLSSRRSVREPAPESSDVPTKSFELALFLLLIDALEKKGGGVVASMRDAVAPISEENIKEDPCLVKARAMVAKLAAVYT